MKNILRITLSAVAALIVLSGAPVAKAATLNVSVGGILLGAHNVDVNGTLYDVTFEDGTCAALFSGCDELSDFTFTTIGGVGAAVQALLDQVFIDSGLGNFDSDPTKTNGCSGGETCTAIIPYDVDSDGFYWAGALNRADSLTDSLVAPGGAFPASYDTSEDADIREVYALFSPSAVPIPGSLVLFGSGLFGLIGIGKRRARKSVAA